MSADLKIVDIKAYPTSFPVPPENRVALGIGTAIKRDAVVVKVTTAGGLVGWGESHHGRAHTAVAKLIETTLTQLVKGMDAADVVGVWKKIYDKQLASHGMGAGTCLAMSGIDCALWDIRGQAAGMPLYKLLGGSRQAVPAYAGGVSLGYQEPSTLIDELKSSISKGLQGGQAARRRHAEAGPGAHPRRAQGLRRRPRHPHRRQHRLQRRGRAPGHARHGRARTSPGWRSPSRRTTTAATGWRRGFGRTPLAAGENHYTRFEFNRVIEDGAITILQPDLSKTGGITEALRIAAMASAYKLPIHPHSSMTGLNHAASIHFLAAIDNGGYFEGDVSKANKFRDDLVSKPYDVDKDGNVWPLDKPGLGLEVNEEFLAKHPPIEGPGYI